ncbi:uncharacterized protein LOC143020134 [Oratosquilla oratoria]|uniref:uncharacterized protein LOC143020134 n=1 Tax=Oratosquilla oratoria TaxID=337810 RepID=UPI003F763EB6
MPMVRSWTLPWEAGHPMSLLLLLFFLLVPLQPPSSMMIVLGATSCSRDFETVVGFEMPSSSYVVTDRSSRVECRNACWVDPSCKAVTVRPSNSSSGLYDCSMTQSTRPAVSTYVQSDDAVSFIRRDDGFIFVGSRFCGISPTVGYAGLGASYCSDLSGYLADVKNKDDLREIIKLLRDFDVNTLALVGLSSHATEGIKYTKWTHPGGSVTYLSSMRSTVLQGINLTTTTSLITEYFAFDLTPPVISLGPFTYYEELPYICCSLS